MYKIRDNSRNKYAISEILSVLLLITIAVGVFVGLHISMMGDSGPETQQSTIISGKLEGDNYIIEHSRGPQLSLDTKCIVNIGGFIENYTVEELLSSESKMDKYWNIGERFAYDLGNISYLQVILTIVDVEKDTVIYEQIIQNGIISEYPYYVITLNPTDIESGSANLWLGYNFRNYSGNVRFSYKKLGDGWTNTAWIPKSGSGMYNITISSLLQDEIYIFRAELTCNSNQLNSTEISILQSQITSVDTITPYKKTGSPTTITVTGNSNLDSVYLWYKYSTDNVSLGENWWHKYWRFRKLITIDSSKVTADLTNFPVLIYESTDSDLSSNAQSDGDDIAFILYSDNSTKLNHEIQSYTDSTGKLIAWIKIPYLSSSNDTKIWMYYGNPTVNNQESVAGVWDSNYVAVWHLDETPNDDIVGHLDSTSNNNHGTPKNFQDGGGGTTNAVGKIGGANYFAGDDDWVEIPHNESLVISGNQLALSAWVKMTSNQDNDEGIIIKSDGSDYNMHLGIQGNERGNFRVKTPSGTTYLTGSTTLSTNQWYYLYGIYNGVTAKLYLNTGEQGTDNKNGNVVSPIASVLIGRRALGDNRYFTGIIDEARISYNTRTSDWFTTEYNNQNSPSTFYNMGSQEEYSGEWGEWSNITNPDTSSPWSFNFDFPDGDGYYKFYSIGKYNGYSEVAPTIEDAICQLDTT
jgi:hypothetical protein